jgi:hypothetical protein
MEESAHHKRLGNIGSNKRDGTYSEMSGRRTKSLQVKKKHTTIVQNLDQNAVILGNASNP